MIKYYGKHSCKQFIRGKPIRFGYKNWMMASASGYCYDFEIYQGKNTMSDKDVGLGGQVVLQFVTKVPNLSERVVVFDNFFTTYPLVVTLKELNVKCSGTLRENHVKLPKTKK